MPRRRAHLPFPGCGYQVAQLALPGPPVASFDLAVWPAAIEQAHAALTFAEMADHPALQGWARLHAGQQHVPLAGLRLPAGTPGQ